MTGLRILCVCVCVLLTVSFRTETLKLTVHESSDSVVEEREEKYQAVAATC